MLDPQWVDASTLVWPRNAHAAVRLGDGRVLVAGGYLAVETSTYSPVAELYDPASATWAATAAMNRGRARHGALLLPSGEALMAAGDDTLVPSAERYDAGTGVWTPTAPMNTPRDNPKATSLSDGRVLVAGGCTSYSSTCNNLTPSAEIYDPATNVWTPTANNMNDPRTLFTLTTLADGRALAAGGCRSFGANFACFNTARRRRLRRAPTGADTASACRAQGHPGCPTGPAEPAAPTRCRR